MNEIPVIGFAAYSGVGKTTLIEKLVRRLKEKGLRVAVVKHDGHAFSMDREGKDTWRYTRAGADVSSSPRRTRPLWWRGAAWTLTRCWPGSMRWT